MPKKNPKDIIEGEVVEALSLQHQLEDTEAELMHLESFQRFLRLQKAVNNKMAEVRKGVGDIMIPAYIDGQVDKTIKGEWGSVTVTESDVFEIDETALPAKFWKKVPDTTKIRATFHLEGKAPKGTTQSKKYGIQLKIK